MLIKALCDFYDVLAAEGKVLEKGFSAVPIQYAVSLSPEGRITGITDIRRERTVADKKGKVKTELEPVSGRFPFREKSTSIKAYRIDHRGKYIFGLSYDPDTNTLSVTDKLANDKFKEKNLEFIEGMDEPLVNAFRNFLTGFVPEEETENPIILEKGKELSKNPDDVERARKYMCDNYFDVRTFGAVMSTGDDPCGIVRGPVQLNFAKSLDPVFEQDITVTRQAITTDGDFNDKGKRTEMGKKHYVPYGLYRAEGYISAMLAQKVTGFSEDDLELLWTAIINMFEHDRSAARGKMCMRKLYIFKHSNALGNCPAHILTDKISCTFTPTEEKRVPRSFSDYVISVDRIMPEGVELIEKL